MHRVFKNEIKIEKGFPDKLGATIDKNGCNFAIYSENAGSVSLLLFNKKVKEDSTIIIPFNNNTNKTGNIWHIYIYGIKEGQLYGYSINGSDSFKKCKAHKFNPNKLLIDPYSKAVTLSCNWKLSNSYGYDINSVEGLHSLSEEKNYDLAIKSIVVDENDFNWGGDKP